MSVKVIGAIGLVSPLLVRGWAAIEGDPDPVQVIITVNGREVGRVEASDARSVHRRGLHPTGRCGFQLKFTEQDALKDGDVVSVGVAGTSQELVNSPMRCTIVSADGESELVAEPIEVNPPPEEVRARTPVQAIIIPSFPKPPHRAIPRVFLDALTAFFLREIRNRFGKSKFGYLWGLVQPIVYMLIFTAARGAVRGFGGEVYGVDHKYFLWCGMIPFFMFNHGFNQGLTSSKGFAGLFNYRQVRPLDLIIVRIFLEFLLMLVVFIILVAGFAFLGFKVSIENWPEWFLIVVMLYLFTLGAVMLAEVAIAANPDIRILINMVERPMILFSGVFFTIHDIPPGLKPYLIWNPFLHATDLARGAMLWKYDSEGSWLYFSAWTFFMLLAGVGAYRSRQYQILS